jgi:N,N-dimethylformamidase beta subunit-like, C-terminal
MAVRGHRDTQDTSIPGIVGYELDRTTALTRPGSEVVGGGSAPCMSAAPGEPVPGPGDDLAESTLYSSPTGAIVFSSGTLGWELGLDPVPSASPDAPRAPDPRVVRITRNLLGHVLGGAISAPTSVSAPAGGK